MELPNEHGIRRTILTHPCRRTLSLSLVIAARSEAVTVTRICRFATLTFIHQSLFWTNDTLVQPQCNESPCCVLPPCTTTGNYFLTTNLLAKSFGCLTDPCFARFFVRTSLIPCFLDWQLT
ncbi:hypothetical protein Hanom_Chr03g00195301 [Helianthus anomalus]